MVDMDSRPYCWTHSRRQPARYYCCFSLPRNASFRVIFCRLFTWVNKL